MGRPLSQIFEPIVAPRPQFAHFWDAGVGSPIPRGHDPAGFLYLPNENPAGSCSSGRRWPHLRVDLDRGDVRFLVDVFDVSFIHVAILHLDLKQTQTPTETSQSSSPSPVFTMETGGPSAP